jgi:LmbE family N-acetylglucosaminyl deacetylase
MAKNTVTSVAEPVMIENTPVSKKQRSVIVFCAHPDDEVIGPGGMLLRYAKEGIKTIVVICSGGDKSHPHYKKSQLVKLRQKESELAAEILQVSHLINLNLPDMRLFSEVQKPEVQNQIRDIILKYDPEKIFTHAIDDILYRDHLAVHDVVMDTVQLLNATKYAKKEKKLSVFTFNIWTINVRKRDAPKLMIDITEEFPYKLKALKCFKSQWAALIQLTPFVYSRALIAGWKKNVKYAEEYYKVL